MRTTHTPAALTGPTNHEILQLAEATGITWEDLPESRRQECIARANGIYYQGASAAIARPENHTTKKSRRQETALHYLQLSFSHEDTAIVIRNVREAEQAEEDYTWTVDGDSLEMKKFLLQILNALGLSPSEVPMRAGRQCEELLALLLLKAQEHTLNSLAVVFGLNALLAGSGDDLKPLGLIEEITERVQAAAREIRDQYADLHTSQDTTEEATK